MAFEPESAMVWMEIPVSDLAKGMAFYEATTGCTLERQEMGPNVMAVFKTKDPMGLGGHLYEGKPSGNGDGPTIHLMAEGTLEETIARIWDAGGKVISPPVEIPAGRFAYAVDPDGNSVGYFEAKA